jgi:hypothetical protein
MTIINSDEKTYYQWSSDKDHPPFQKGQWRWSQKPPFNIEIPSIHRMQKGDASIHLLSQGPVSKQANQIIIYDDWTERLQLKHPLRPAPSNILKTVIFLDHSATMNNPWQNSSQSAWEISLQHLLKKRHVQADNWKILTFASDWTSHGNWQAHQEFSLQSLGQPKGKTKWSETLESWLLTQPAPSHLIMIGDGKIEERNLRQLEKTLEQLKSKGHQITALSPELKPLQHWEQLYQSHIVHHNWKKTESKPIRHKIHSTLPMPCEWTQVTKAIAGHQHLPLIWSNEGYLLMSCEFRENGPIYHLAGTPSVDPLHLLQNIKKNQQHPLFVEIHASHLVVDLQNESKAPMTQQSTQGPQYIWPDPWGIYKIFQKSNQISITHPQYGIIQLKGMLDFQNRVFKETAATKQAPLTQSSSGAFINFILALLHLLMLVLTAFQLKKRHA